MPDGLPAGGLFDSKLVRISGGRSRPQGLPLKSDVGGYTYGANGIPHAVTHAGGVSYEYDGSGHIRLAGGQHSREHDWTAFGQPRELRYQDRSVSFAYDHGHKRIRETIRSGATERVVDLVHPDNEGGLGYEREVTRVDGVAIRDESRHYTAVGGVVVAVVKTLNGAGAVPTDPAMTLYWHRDALGSVVAVSRADVSQGGSIERMAFDPWGKRLSWAGRADPLLDPAHGDRGFTGHEHLDELQVVHMNGRVCDPLLARFFSPDPVLQQLHNLQNHNRYSYVLNRPLGLVDPSGNEAISGMLLLKIGAAVAGAAMVIDGNKHWSRRPRWRPAGSRRRDPFPALCVEDASAPGTGLRLPGVNPARVKVVVASFMQPEAVYSGLWRGVRARRHRARG